MSRGSPLIVLGVVGVAVAAASLAAWMRPERLPDDPLALAPEGTTAVLRADVPALLASPLWAAAVGEGDEGYQRIVETCGFDPLADLSTADVYVIGTARRPLDQIGFVARGRLRHQELVACLGTITESDGGGVHEVEIEGVRAIASDHGSSRAAFIGAEAVVGGDESLVRDLIRRVHGEGASLADDEVLGALYQRVRHRGDLMAVARVPESWSAVIARSVASDPAWEPASTLSALGIGAQIRSGLGLTVVAQVADADAARDLRGALTESIASVLERPLVRLSVLGGALRRIEADTDGASLVITIDLDGEELAAAVAYGRDVLAAAVADPGSALPGPPSGDESPGEIAPSPGHGDLPPPDEVIER